MCRPIHLISMLRIFFFLLLTLTVHESLQAQIGIVTIGTSCIGNDSLFVVPPIGKTTTPICPLPGPCESGCAIYTFTGSGEWNIEGNWEGGLVPPVTLSGCTQIIINPIGTQECLLNIPLQIIPTGTTITVMTGKKFRIPGRLAYQ